MRAKDVQIGDKLWGGYCQFMDASPVNVVEVTRVSIADAGTDKCTVIVEVKDVASQHPEQQWVFPAESDLEDINLFVN